MPCRLQPDRTPPPRLCLRLPPHGPRPISTPQPGAESATDAFAPLRCHACLFPITDEKQRMAMDGTHQHTFFNPNGHVFHIGCFRRAPGCAAVGIPSGEFTWFAGHLWQIALCAGCRLHLGWRFAHTSDSTSFWGLILNRLVSKE